MWALHLQSQPATEIMVYNGHVLLSEAKPPHRKVDTKNSPQEYRAQLLKAVYQSWTSTFTGLGFVGQLSDK